MSKSLDELFEEWWKKNYEKLNKPKLAWFAGAEAQKGLSMETFQAQVRKWVIACFGEKHADDIPIRNYRFLEEALELVQANGCSKDEAYQLVDYVFGRKRGEPAQEIGGSMTTLAALCAALGLDMHSAGDEELKRCWINIEKIRAKNLAKPKFGPLP